METATVYRNGAVRPGKHSEEIYLLWEPYDRIRPLGRAGRLNSVYASPSLAGMVRWTHSNIVEDKDRAGVIINNEIIVCNPENIYVYSVDAYDTTSADYYTYRTPGTSGAEEFDAELMRPYWDSGIRLTEWQKKALEEDLNPMDWEVLIPMDSIVSYSPIEDDDVIAAAPEKTKEQLWRAIRATRNFIDWVNYKNRESAKMA